MGDAAKDADKADAVSCSAYIGRHITEVVKALTDVAQDVKCLAQVNDALKDELNETCMSKCEAEKLKLENAALRKEFEHLKSMKNVVEMLCKENDKINNQLTCSSSLVGPPAEDPAQRMEELKDAVMGIKCSSSPCELFGFNQQCCYQDPCCDQNSTIYPYNDCFRQQQTDCCCKDPCCTASGPRYQSNCCAKDCCGMLSSCCVPPLECVKKIDCGNICKSNKQTMNLIKPKARVEPCLPDMSMFDGTKKKEIEDSRRRIQPQTHGKNDFEAEENKKPNRFTVNFGDEGKVAELRNRLKQNYGSDSDGWFRTSQEVPMQQRSTSSRKYLNDVMKDLQEPNFKTNYANIHEQLEDLQKCTDNLSLVRDRDATKIGRELSKVIKCAKKLQKNHNL